EVGLLQQFLALASVLGPNQCLQQVVQVALDPFAQHEPFFTFRPPTTVRGKAVKRSRRKSPRRTEPDIVVTGRGREPVTVGTADVRRRIVERAATQHTAIRGFYA